MSRWIALALVPLCLQVSVPAADRDAIEISANIRARHMPHGVLVDPIFEGPESEQIIAYTRCGDAAIWTGHFLAAESYRYAVTRSPQALDNVYTALAGIRYLLDVTGTDLLARCVFPVNSLYAGDFSQEEAHHGIRTGIVDGQNFFWVGNTSRDQYLGVGFGLVVSHDLVDDPGVREAARWLGTRLVKYLVDNNWAVRMPDGHFSTVFWARADQELGLLQIGRRLNPDRFNRLYQVRSWLILGGVVPPIAAEALDPHNSYFKFNLDAINFFSLIRLGGNSVALSTYRTAYEIFREATLGHGNAHFNMIDRALNGPDAKRDAETRALLEQWLTRPRRDFYVDLHDGYRTCEEDNRSCEVIPVPARVATDFLWQRSPFQLSGGGSGRVENPGIDYILPYWMARYYRVIE
jgi:hypothetical protein